MKKDNEKMIKNPFYEGPTEIFLLNMFENQSL